MSNYKMSFAELMSLGREYAITIDEIKIELEFNYGVDFMDIPRGYKPVFKKSELEYLTRLYKEVRVVVGTDEDAHNILLSSLHENTVQTILIKMGLEEPEQEPEEERYNYPEEHYEPHCHSCGDGGCIHCTPSWFI